MKTEKKDIILVGGGTGGHAAPVLALYEKLIELEPDLRIVVVGAGTEFEREFFRNIADYRVVKSGKMNRFITLKNISEFINLLSGYFMAIKLLKETRPDMIFSKGGFASLPVMWAAKSMKISYFLHESDIEMGQANRMMAKSAKTVFTGFPEKYYHYLSNTKIIFTGPLLRSGFLGSDAHKNIFGFKSGKPIILVTGGSQGSLNIGQNFLSIVKKLIPDYNVIHQTGKQAESLIDQALEGLSDEEKAGYYHVDFLRNESGKDMMLEAINAADLIITRAGSTVEELAIKGKLMIIIPWKHAASDHQNKNANFFEENKAALVIREDDLTPEKLFSEIKNLFSDTEKSDVLRKNAINLFPSDGSEKIAKEILKEIKK